MTTYEQPKDWIERHLVEDPGGLLACEPSRLDTLNEELRLARQANEAQHQQLEAMTAERDKAKAMPMKYRRMEFNAQLQDEIESLRQELAASESRLHEVSVHCATVEQQIDDHIKREVMLRDGLKRADDLLRTSYDHESPLIKEALSATADLENVRLCEKEPCRDDGRCQYAIDHCVEGLGHCPEGKCCMPLYRAWRPK